MGHTKMQLSVCVCVYIYIHTNSPLYCGSVFVVPIFRGFSVRPINFDITYIFVISWHSVALFISSNLVRHDRIAVRGVTIKI